MKEFIDGDTVFTVIKMMRQVDSRTVVLVEGVEDTAIIDPHLDATFCRSEIGYGKKNALEAAKLANDNGIGKVLTVVDRDFDCAAELKQKAPHVSVSESYDLESDIFHRCSCVLRRVVSAHTNRDALNKHLQSVRLEMGELIVEIAGCVGVLRRISIRDALGLRLDKFPMHPLIDAHQASRLTEEVSALAVSRSNSASISTEELSSLLKSRMTEYDLRDSCCSHDIVNLLSALISKKWGGPSGADALGRAYRSSVDWECFDQLPVCADLRAWGRELNAPVWARDS